MITYRMKDQERQAALEKAFPGFNEVMQEAVRNRNDTRSPFIDVIDEFGMWCVTLLSSEIALTNEYSPDEWNQFPDVMPPEGVLMRIEHIYEGVLRRSCAIFEKGAWYVTEDGKPSHAYFTFNDVRRFRQWE